MAQYFRAASCGEKLADINARHGNEPSVTFYTHLSDQFGPYYTKVIAATASEAPHVLDGLLYHQTGLQIEEQYTDTGGATKHVFGLCHLFSFRFAPHIRDLKDRRLYLFPGQSRIRGSDPLSKDSPMCTTLQRTGTISCGSPPRFSGIVTASAILQKLSAYPRQNGLAVALREIGRI